MLTKLLKYEFMASARTYGALYLALLCAAALLGLQIGSTGGNNVNQFLLLVYLGLCAAVAVVTVMTIVQRFSRNLLGREGYLMHTLPVTSNQLIASKLISSAAWSVCSLAVGCVSFAVLLAVSALSLGTSLAELLGVDWSRVLAADSNGVRLSQLALAVIIIVLARGVCMITRIYAACMAGHLVKKHPTAAGIGAFCALSLAQSWVESLISGLCGTLSATSSAVQVEFASTDSSALGLSTQLWGADGAALGASAQLWGVVLYYVLISAAFGALYFALTAWLMNEKLDLE